MTPQLSPIWQLWAETLGEALGRSLIQRSGLAQPRPKLRAAPPSRKAAAASKPAQKAPPPSDAPKRAARSTVTRRPRVRRSPEPIQVPKEPVKAVPPLIRRASKAKLDEAQVGAQVSDAPPPAVPSESAPRPVPTEAPMPTEDLFQSLVQAAARSEPWKRPS